MRETARRTHPLTAHQRALLELPETRRLIAATVKHMRRRHPHLEPGEIEALANEALVLAARRYRADGGARFTTFAQARVAGHVTRAMSHDYRALVRWLPRDPMGRPGGKERWHRLVTALRSLESVDPETALIAADERRRVEEALTAALGRLSPADRRLVHRRFIEGVTVSALALELGCSVRTARRTLARILCTLRHALLAEGVDAPPPELSLAA